MLFTLCVGIGCGMTFLASSVLLANYFGRAPYLELFSVMNLISTLACLAPSLLGLLRIFQAVSHLHFNSYYPCFSYFGDHTIYAPTNLS